MSSSQHLDPTPEVPRGEKCPVVDRSVLIVEDDKTTRTVLTRIMQQRGYHVTACESAEEAWDAYKRDSHPLILLDWMLGGMNGLELCRKIRALPRGDYSVVVAVTGRNSPEDLEAMLEAGADDYVSKPIDFKLLKVRLTIAEKVVCDVARRKEAEKALLDANAELRDAYLRLKENQVQLVNAEKMASLGRLAAGMAHEINNPIGYLTSNLGSLGRYLSTYGRVLKAHEGFFEELHAAHADAADDIGRHLDDVERMHRREDLDFLMEDAVDLVAECLEGAQRVKDIVESLKRFALVDEAQQQKANLKANLENTLSLMRHELTGCDVVKKTNDLPLIECYPGRLNQVFVNVVRNAVQAMEGRGTLTVETGVADDHIVIKISDTGPGMPDHVREQVFTPFYTTKAVGDGRGLGMSVAYGIIQQHGGDITIESEEARGTTVAIHLPLHPIGGDGMVVNEAAAA